MFIEEVLIDGFKSYARKTTIGKFDSKFNAITGLNGSGKSNILDAICFVMGIQNLSLVRVQTLQELIYKSGQCGVTKATVTIVFNNNDKANSPTGYEGYDQITVARQITVTGKNKYMLNGKVLPQSHILTFFRAIGLNVNNPHFLIMQGKVVKVLNMKPMEILAMVEEVTGTKMYETKRAEAVKVLEKKDSKLKEIDDILREEITPSREKLKKDAEALVNLRNKKTASENLEMKIHAFDYYRAEKKFKDLNEEIKILEGEISNNEKIIEKMRDEIDGMAEDLGEQLLNTDEKEKEATKIDEEIEVMKTRNDASKEREKSLNNKIEKIKRDIKRVEEDEGENDERLIREKEWIEKRVEELELRLGKMNGLSQSEDVIGGITIAMKKVRKECEDLIRQKQKPIPGKVNKEEVESTIKEILNEEKNLEYQCNNWNGSNEVESELYDLERDLEAKRRKFEEANRKMNFSFRYSLPSADFDRNRVKGLIVTLFTPKENKYSTALEIAAGPKIFHVVVDSDITASLLVEKKCLKKRMTFIPLNKIAPQMPNLNQIKQAKEIGGNKIQYALDVVQCEPEFIPIMKYVFGNVLIAEDAETAKKVCFNPKVMMKTVTVSGDLYDPSGILTGGSKPKSSGFLDEIRRQNGLKREWEDCQKLIEEKKTQLAQFQEIKRIRENLQFARERRKKAEYELEELDRMNEERERMIKQREKLERMIQEKEKELADLTNRKEEAINERKRMEGGQGEAVKKELQNKIEEEKGKLDKISKEIKRAEEQTRKREIEKMKIEDWEKEKATHEKELSNILLEREDIKHEIEVKEKRLEQLKREIKEIKIANSEKVRRVKEMNEQKQLKGKKVGEKENELKRITKEKEKKEEEIKNIGETIRVLEKKYLWIKTEKKQFNKKGGIFDFSTFNINSARKELAEIGKEQIEIERSVNKQVVLHQQKVEDEYKDLMTRKHIIETDKDKIVKVINDLDEKMKDAIQEAYEFVNVKFGSIFSSLHPGASAKLVPYDGRSIFNGIEARVRLGDMWKESLIELSGGQKSLLALSLILAILLYKPSPLYILDEVDAALDVSNTQNFGGMLREHFKASQFIVVSLKSGMFDNANILFNTKVY
ncbi:mitotic chromosome and x-chromosome-associated protein putative [Entamoeba histolytica]|uniref:Mitotic chromosome and x-chromosome-associated protein putative n=1 Tax=Entamoeba histolytica TaxID=5759 RepID=A0A175JFL0_ENTHI|nr:mitotic chromosome and x-chromosome-associated protein putative [Entamoeba histolytica]